uniref:Amidase n=1 Tax=Coccidioides posadasii RMSCC 3488 TaxID=454284 RepID=A0A0J6F670_COCPO|nr:amidase [Coccidioides posadasii RMSCC 3488]
MTTKDRIETTAGSWALQGSVVPRDAYVVHKSRKAGALLLAKAGMSEWAEIRKMDYSQGYAAFGRQGRSAIISLYTLVEAAQALRLRYLLIRRLSHWTLRPTEVAIMLSERWERTVRDATHVLDAIYGIDRRNNYTLAQKGKTPGEGRCIWNTLEFLLEIGDSAQIAQLLELVDLIKGAVATIVSGTEITDYERIIPPDG